MTVQIVSELACGHLITTQGVPREGQWITCRPCQGQQRIVAANVGGVLF